MTTEKAIELIKKIFPDTKGNAMANSLAIMKRETCKEFLYAVENAGENVESRCEQLESTIVDLNREIDRLTKSNIEAAKQVEPLKKEVEELKKKLEESENKAIDEEDVNRRIEAEKDKLYANFERVLENRVNKALAEEKERTHNFDPAIRKQYNELVKAERMRTTMMIQTQAARPQIITSDVLTRFKTSYAPLVVYNAEGRSFFMRWHDLYTACFTTNEFNTGQFTHYMVVPKVTLEDLIGRAKCEGCKYHNSDGENICQLPACIKDNEGISE